jgi:hypothetical protein
VHVNKLSRVPDAFFHIRTLETLNLNEVQLTELPDAIDLPALKGLGRTSCLWLCISL